MTVDPAKANEKFVQLLTGQQNQIYMYILSLVGNPVDARDVLQETNLVLWRKADEFEPDSDFAAWAGTVARYQVLAYRSQCSRDRLIFDDAVVAQLVDSHGVDDVDSPEHEVALRECVEQLKPADRQALHQRYEPDGSVKEVAKSLDRTPVATAAYLLRQL